MIIIEEHDDLNEDCDLIIPISLRRYNNGEVEITTYREALDIAREFEALFYDDPFCDGALRWLDSKLAVVIDRLGYYREDKFNEWYYVFNIDKAEQINDSTVTGAVMLKDMGDLQNETSYELDMILEFGQTAFVMINDNKVVSICVENFINDDDSEVEIAVETSPKYRGMGYAKAVIAAMCRHMIEQGKAVTYRCSCFNYPSVKTVISAGFKESGKEYYYNCYKK